ncbi:hypothetical protein SLE2022_174790 [Rubroshorea leprosula]
MAPGSTAYLANTASFASKGSPLMNAIPFPLLHKELFFFFLKFHHLCKLMLLSPPHSCIKLCIKGQRSELYWAFRIH